MMPSVAGFLCYMKGLAPKGLKGFAFGSYGWGDGEWMRSWEETCRGDGAKLVTESVICMETPDDEAEAACRALGAALA